MMAYIFWVLALIASCSGLPMQEDTLGLPILPALPWPSSIQTKGPKNFETPVLLDIGESSGVRQGHKVGVFPNNEDSSSELDEDVSHVSKSHDGGGEVPLSLPDTDVLSYLDTAALFSELKGTQPPLVSLKSTSAESSAASTSPADSSAVLSGAGEMEQADELTARDVPEHVEGDLSSLLTAAATGGHSRHRPEPGLAPSETKLSSRRNGVPQLEMLENLSKPRKGVQAPPDLPEPAPTAAGKKQSSRRTGVPDLEMLESPSKPRKGAPPPPPPLDGSTEGGAAGSDVQTSSDAAHTDPPELPTAEPTLDPVRAREQATMENLAKARAAVIVGGMFGVLSVLLLGWYGVRRVTDSWHHRHYRKMDFLVDGMYNM